MPKTLLTWIGNKDLEASEGKLSAGLGPIAQAVVSRRFDRIILLYNQPQVKIDKYVDWLRGHTDSRIETYQEKLTSPTNYEEIYNAAFRVVSKVVKQSDPSTKLTFHISPGTPAMTAIWIILAKTQFTAELIESSPQAGVQTVSVPFEISAEFVPNLLRHQDEELERLSEGLPPEAPEFADITHRSAAMKKLIALARRVAPRKISVLIEGESGTGKELLSRAIHRASPRRDKPFIAVNCGAIPENLIESELFGHVQGAFTDAKKARTGHFEEADGGTLFLDEIGELPLAAQVKLLRTLQESEIVKVGASKPKKIDVRIIAATNRRLIDEAAEGRFRQDLYFRLAVAILRIPPLRERQGDISELIDRILEQITGDGNDQGFEHKSLSASAKSILIKHDWPGNVRELQSSLVRAALWSTGPIIKPEDIRSALSEPLHNERLDILNRSIGDGFQIGEVMRQVAHSYLKRAYDQSNGKKVEAAKLLGFSNYQTFSNWMKKYNVDEGT